MYCNDNLMNKYKVDFTKRKQKLFKMYLFEFLFILNIIANIR